ncbi:GNAT family N-acetyltransferase [Glutamicibacter sp. JC586]|uniref:GNAT family N-acetyltransferase n=1 Tax=Glutamicibacter sp. JC586 TaxID=2590552 RepID=UPI00135AC49B|nr:GNAT family N-acetyltransferase [Glutamicibacter sp. JC586]
MSALFIDSCTTLRLLQVSDAEQLAEGYARNREHLRPWEPERDEAFFTKAWQAENISQVLAAHEHSLAYPYGLFRDEQLIGRFNIVSVVRGSFQSASLGYWVDHQFTGQALASRSIAALRTEAATNIGLHRLEASTLVHNHASQKVLLKNGFSQIGMAPNYLKIAGRWQDHNLYQTILHG